PYLGELMEFASIKGLKNRIGSNGFLLTKNNVLMKKLEFCDNLDISLRVANQDDFSLICKSNRLSFEKYLERIRAFISEIKKYNTILTIRMFSDNSSQNILDRIGINFNVLGAPLMTPIKYDTDFYLYFEDCLSREWTYSTLSKPYFDGKCSEFYYSIVVLANGDVTICCWDFNGENVVGNIHTQKGIVNVLESNNYRKVRERFNHNIVPFKLCTTCTQLNKKGVYFEKD
ncbi:Fe-S oxidoreductase, partial [Candidatus Magnetomorum sp. HK-1]